MALVLLLSIVVTGAANAQTWLLDFGANSWPVTNGPAPGDPVYTWNNIGDTATSPTGQRLDLLTSSNTPTPVDFIVVRRFNGVNQNGTDASALYPANATRDSLYGNTEVWNNMTDIFPSFKLTGLEPATSYRLKFYASRADASDNRETAYTVEGETTEVVALDAANNTNNVAMTSALKPSSMGEITVSLAPGPNNTSPYHFTYLGIMELNVIPPQTPIGFLLQPGSQRVVVYKPVTFTASVTGAPPYSIQWYQNGSLIPGANAFSYTIPIVTPDMDGTTFRVSVSNLVYGATSTNAVLQVLTDTNPPTIISATSPGGITVLVQFSEAMEPFSTAEPSFYLVNDQTVAAAVLQPDNKSVQLTLWERQTTNFTLKVTQVMDMAGNVIAPDTSLLVQVPPLPPEGFLLDFGGGNTTLVGPSPDDPINVWNNIGSSIGGSSAGELFNLVTSHGNATEVGLVMISRFNGVNENGTQASTLFPADATRDSLFGNTEVFSGMSNIFPSFKLTGLDPTKSYDFTFYASRMGVTDNRETGYSLSGANSNFVTLNASGNINNTVTGQIKPSSAGEVIVALAPTANNNNANHFTYLGVMKVMEASIRLQFAMPVISGNQIQLQWTGSGSLEWAPAMSGPWTKVSPAPVGSYSEAVVTGQNRFYRLVP